MGDVNTGLRYELIADLTEELKKTDENFNSSLLSSKVKAVIREVKRARNYPDYYTEEQINNDMENYYSNIRGLALYDYNLIGAEGQVSSSENGNGRSYVDRNSYFNGIIPLSR